MTPEPIFPSILSTNFFDLESHLREFENHHIEFIHLDVMDGHFVDNLSFGPSAIKAIKSKFNFKFDSHLMIDNPMKMIPKFIAGGSDWISFHLEVVDKDSVREVIRLIKDGPCKAGLVINPSTEVSDVFPYLDQLDYVLIMSVFPGYSGQKFIPETVGRVAELKRRLTQTGSPCRIAVDGGVNADNIGDLKQAGADFFVIGTFLYNSENIDETLTYIRKKLNMEQSY
ncbi:MAG: ribulose-phosphate 3-epimerase [Candidatus Omnitrophota bacterium]